MSLALIFHRVAGAFPGTANPRTAQTESRVPNDGTPCGWLPIAVPEGSPDSARRNCEFRAHHHPHRTTARREFSLWTVHCRAPPTVSYTHLRAHETDSY